MSQPEVRRIPGVLIPPVNGWNTKDPISSMDPSYSPEIENWFPNGSTVDMRRGCRQHAKGLGSTYGQVVDTIAEYVKNDGTRKLLAIGDSLGASEAIGDATSAGSVSAVTVPGFGIGHPAWSLNYANTLIVKGDISTRDVHYWDGSGALALNNFTGPGGDDKDLGCPISYRGRIYFLQRTAPSIWFHLTIGAVTGALTENSFSSHLRRGGRFLFIGSTTLGGNNIDEVFVLISEMGEVLLYAGEYPGASNWQQIGRYYIPAPIGVRSFFYWGQDIVVITHEGLVALSAVIAAGPRGQFEYLTDNINPSYAQLIEQTLADPVDSYYFTSGIHYPKGRYLLINLPINDGSTFSCVQLVMNTITGAWTKFTNQNALSWSLFNNNLYFGTVHGKVFRADYNTSDTSAFDEDPANEGQPLSRNSVCAHAYNYFDRPGTLKRFVHARPFIYASNGLNIKCDMATDYGNQPPAAGAVDTNDTSYKLYQPQIGLTGVADAGSLRIEKSGTSWGRMSLQVTEVAYEVGKVI